MPNRRRKPVDSRGRDKYRSSDVRRATCCSHCSLTIGSSVLEASTTVDYLHVYHIRFRSAENFITLYYIQRYISTYVHTFVCSYMIRHKEDFLRIKNKKINKIFKRFKRMNVTVINLSTSLSDRKYPFCHVYDIIIYLHARAISPIYV